MTRLVMNIQHRVKSAVKPLLFDDVASPQRVKAGPGRGVVALLNRRHDLQREFCAFDVGAADGLTSLIYARLGATVIAFEPEPTAVTSFVRNLELNPSLAARITLVQDYYRPDNYPEPEFVKIDVDGAERDVLRLIPGHPRCVIVETHSEYLESECNDLLLARGYTVDIIRNARWRRFYPEYRPIGFNRWLIALA